MKNFKQKFYFEKKLKKTGLNVLKMVIRLFLCPKGHQNFSFFLRFLKFLDFFWVDSDFLDSPKGIPSFQIQLGHTYLFG